MLEPHLKQVLLDHPTRSELMQIPISLRDGKSQTSKHLEQLADWWWWSNIYIYIQYIYDYIYITFLTYWYHSAEKTTSFDKPNNQPCNPFSICSVVVLKAILKKSQASHTSTLCGCPCIAACACNSASDKSQPANLGPSKPAAQNLILCTDRFTSI